MQKIPTVFKRDPDDMRHLLREVHPDCQWVLDGEGVATRKYDGTCVLLRRDGLGIHAYARREVGPQKEPPANWVLVDYDKETGKSVGWEPAAQSSWMRFINEALTEEGRVWVPGTYELCGPKINQNPEGYSTHRLIEHATAEFSLDDRDHNLRDYDAMEDLVLELKRHLGWEGIVYHHPNGRMAKIKARDFG